MLDPRAGHISLEGMGCRLSVWQGLPLSSIPLFGKWSRIFFSAFIIIAWSNSTCVWSGLSWFTCFFTLRYSFSERFITLRVVGCSFFKQDWILYMKNNIYLPLEEYTSHRETRMCYFCKAQVNYTQESSVWLVACSRPLLNTLICLYTHFIICK